MAAKLAKESEPAVGIEGMAGTELSSADLELMHEGSDAPAKRDAEPTPEPKELAPAAEPPAEPPQPKLEVAPPAEPPAPVEPPLSEHDRFLSEIKDLPIDELRDRMTRLHRDSIGQRGAIARINQARRDRELELDNVRGELQRSEERRIAVERLGNLEPPAPSAPPAPKTLRVQQDAEGNYFLDAEAARELLAPKPPPPDPQQQENLRLRADFETIAGKDPAFRPTLERLEGARQFLLTGLQEASRRFGHQLRTPEDTENVMRAYGLDQQVAQHFPGVEFGDLMDLMRGGRLAERVVRQFARAWYPQGVKEQGGPPRPILYGDDGTPESGDNRAPEPAPGPAPKHTGPAQRLPLGDKPPTMSRRGGVRPEPESAMNRFLDTTVDDLLKRPKTELEALLAGAHRELESGT